MPPETMAAMSRPMGSSCSLTSGLTRWTVGPWLLVVNGRIKVEAVLRPPELTGAGQASDDEERYAADVLTVSPDAEPRYLRHKESELK